MSNITAISKVETDINVKLADDLQAIADEIRTKNEYGVFRAIIILDGRSTIETKSLGAGIKAVDALGLIEFAKFQTANVWSKT